MLKATRFLRLFLKKKPYKDVVGDSMTDEVSFSFRNLNLNKFLKLKSTKLQLKIRQEIKFPSGAFGSNHLPHSIIKTNHDLVNNNFFTPSTTTKKRIKIVARTFSHPCSLIFHMQISHFSSFLAFFNAITSIIIKHEQYKIECNLD